MKNNRGFTLPELLAAVVILGILSSIAIVTVTKTIEKSHREYDKKQNELFTAAAQTYYTDNRDKLPQKLLTEKSITLKKLIEENYIDKIKDYKKKPYNQDESIAYVKKTGAGKYMYYSILVSEDNKRRIGTEQLNKKSEDINIKIKTPKTESTDMQTPLQENNKDVYYVNKKIEVSIEIDSSKGISSYQYKINKLKNLGDKTGKKYKTSSEIAVDKATFNDTITINAKDFSNGIYKLSIDAYGYNTEVNNETSNYIIVIDKTKPKCEIKMTGPKPTGSPVIEEGAPPNLHWYKKSDIVKATMTITEKNRYQYSFDQSEQSTDVITFDNDNNNDNKSYEYSITSNVKGLNLYGYVKDKAGNIGKCMTEKPIYYDNTEPTCEINPQTEPDGENDFYVNPVNLNIEEVNDQTEDIESGILEQNYAFNTTGKQNNLSFGPSSKDKQKYDTDDNGLSWYGYVKDKAGNIGSCKTKKPLKVDLLDPTCHITISPSRPSGENGWYNKENKPTVYLNGIINTSKRKTIYHLEKIVVGTQNYDATTREKQVIYDNNSLNTSVSDTTSIGVKYYGYVKKRSGNTGHCVSNIIKVDTANPRISTDPDVQQNVEGAKMGFQYDNENEKKGYTGRRTVYCKEPCDDNKCSGFPNFSSYQSTEIDNSPLKLDMVADGVSIPGSYGDNAQPRATKTSFDKVQLSFQYVSNGEKDTTAYCYDQAGNEAKKKINCPYGIECSTKLKCVCRKTGTNRVIIDVDDKFCLEDVKKDKDGNQIRPSTYCNCSKGHPDINGKEYKEGELYLSCYKDG